MIERSDDTEEVDAVPVLAEDSAHGSGGYGREIVPRRAPAIVQTAAVAAGGFVAGAAVLGLVYRRQTRRAALAAARPRRRIARAGARAKQAGGIAEIVASRSLLVDVHLLGSPASSARGR
ncbi:MAG: hypothetical protein ACRDK4_06915 [Solirubrobacteraceae bacterium]